MLITIKKHSLWSDKNYTCHTRIHLRVIPVLYSKFPTQFLTLNANNDLLSSNLNPRIGTLNLLTMTLNGTLFPFPITAQTIPLQSPTFHKTLNSLCFVQFAFYVSNAPIGTEYVIERFVPVLWFKSVIANKNERWIENLFAFKTKIKKGTYTFPSHHFLPL